jgi:hypothetical protein
MFSVGKPYLGPIFDGSPHWTLWKLVEEELSGWQFVDSTGKKVTTPTIGNILQNIKGYKLIWDILKK